MANETTLLTARLHLSAFAPDDAEDVFAYASLDEASRYMTFESHASLADSERFIERVSSAPDTQFDWAVREQGDDTVRGAIELTVRSPAEAEVHYALHPSLWGRGFATEGLRAVLNWAFRTYEDLERIVAPIVDVNERSVRVVEKSAMSFRSDYVEHWPKHGRDLRMVVWGVDRETWAAQEWATEDHRTESLR